MQKMCLVFLFAAVTLIGCTTMSRKPNVFYLDGRRVTLTDTYLSRIRAMWIAGQELTYDSQLKPKDRQWTLDMIALREELKHKCTKLELLGLDKNKTNVDLVLYGKTYHPIEFSEVWVLNSCGTQASYHVFEDKRMLTVLPAAL